jgi:hypothetical protein
VVPPGQSCQHLSARYHHLGQMGSVCRGPVDKDCGSDGMLRVSRELNDKSMSDWLADAVQTLGIILTRASCTALSRSAFISGSWYGMARMR